MVTKRNIGVYICHCGGNISDYVDVEQLAAAVRNDPGVGVARTHVFTCSDASQQEMIDEIIEKKLDGLVIASCSPKLHMFTFRAMAQRAGLNMYQYVQVNLREQCSWVHTNNKTKATEKGINIVRAGIAKCLLTKPLTAIRIDTIPKVLIIGGGIAGLRAALAVSDLGMSSFIVEREKELGGNVAKWGSMFPTNSSGRAIARKLIERVNSRENIMVYTEANLIKKGGSIGNFDTVVKLANGEELSLNVGAIIVTTGFKSYSPKDGEYLYGNDRVVTMPDFIEYLDKSKGELKWKDSPVKNVAFIYCVGSRQEKSDTCPEPNIYCSRYCCTAGVHTGLEVEKKAKEAGVTINQYHLYQDMRTYGVRELLYESARRKMINFIRFSKENLPSITENGDNLTIKIKDELLAGEEIEIPADLVVLVTGMEPSNIEELNDVLKLPISKDGFLNEIHIKLRPVETVIDGVFIAGAAQSPKTMAESVASGLAAVSKASELLLKGFVDLEPLVAIVDKDKCEWCDECTKACAFDAVSKIECDGKSIAFINSALCKGEGACVPLCPKDAIDVEGYRDDQIRAMIKASIMEVSK